MLVSELIQKLEALKAEFGDVPAKINDAEYGEVRIDSVSGNPKRILID